MTPSSDMYEYSLLMGAAPASSLSDSLDERIEVVRYRHRDERNGRVNVVQLPPSPCSLQRVWRTSVIRTISLARPCSLPALGDYEPFANSSAVRDSNSKPTTGSSPTTHAS